MTDKLWSRGVLALVVLTVGFAAIAISSRFLSFYLTLFQQLYFSVALGFVFSLIIFPRTLTWQKLKNIPLKDILILFFRVVIGYLLAGALYRQAIVITKISNVTFIQSLPFAGIFGWLFFKEKFSFKKLVLLALAWFGAGLIAVKSFSSLFNFGTGEIFSFLSAGLFSLSYVSRKWQTDYLNDKEITQILLGSSALCFFGLSLVKQEGLPFLGLNPVFLTSLIFTGFFNTINIYLINFGFNQVKAVLASNILTLEAVFSLVLALFFFQELPNLKEFIGGAMIVLSVLMMNKIAGQEKN